MSEGGGGSQTDGESFYEAVYSFYENQFRDLRQYLLNKYFYDLGSPSTAFPTSSTSSSTLNILSPNDSPAKKARTKRENKPLDEDHPSSSQNFDDVDDADEDADEDADADDNDDDDDHDEDQNENENDEDDTHIINDGCKFSLMVWCFSDF